jgi:hypothetical protein
MIKNDLVPFFLFITILIIKMAYNYNEAEILEEMFKLYDKNDKIYSIDSIYNQLREILYNLVIYNDYDNTIEIIREYGGFEMITQIYNSKYINTTILEIDVESKFNEYTFAAFIGMFDYLFSTILGVIEEIENEELMKTDEEKSMDSLCNLMANL